MTEQYVRDYGLKPLFYLLWNSKVTIIIFTLVFSIMSVFIAISLPNKYQAEVLLDYVRETEGGMNFGGGQIGQIASLAGFSLGAGKGNNQESVDMAVLTSRRFLSQFIEKNELLIPLFAAKEWDLATKKLVLNSEIYDSIEEKWVRKVNWPLVQKPTYLEAVNIFNELLQVEKDKKTGLIQAKITFLSPILAHEWLELLFKDFNQYVRAQDVINSERNINYLKNKALEVNNSNIKSIFFTLLEEEHKKMMLAQVSKDFVIKTIDPSIVPLKRFSPKRSLICMAGAVLGSFLGVFFVLIRQFFRVN